MIFFSYPATITVSDNYFSFLVYLCPAAFNKNNIKHNYYEKNVSIHRIPFCNYHGLCYS